MSLNNLFEFDNKMRNCLQGEEALTPDNFKACRFIIGTDEAGRGPGAGGVFAAAVCFESLSDEFIAELSFLNDSKKLSAKKREALFDKIIENTINSVVCVEVEEIEEINILNASLKAMKLACENVAKEKGQDEKEKDNILVLVDGNKLIKNFNYPQKFIIKGDSKSASIAAASILAKVSRDRYMKELHDKYPQYNWAKNAGYLTKEHIKAIEEFGITPHHRKSFLKNIQAKQLSLC